MIELFFLAMIFGSNVFWYFKYTNLKNQIKARSSSQELDEFIRDLANGGGIISVKRIAPMDVLIRHRRA